VRRRALAAAFAVALACGATARDAVAAAGAGAFTTELGAGTMLSSDQRDKLGYSTAVHGALLAGVSMTDALMLQVSLGSWWFPSSQGYGRDTMFGLGLRFEPKVGTLGRLVVDAHPSITRSGGLARFGFDAGAGYEFALGRWLGAGPMLRYGQVRSIDADGTDDAKFWSLGLSVTLRCGD
jgi:hypothetical protein